MIPTLPSYRENTHLLVRLLERMLRERGAVSVEEACSLLLGARRVPPSLAHQLLHQLVAGDRRFRISADGAVSLEAPSTIPSPRLRETRFTVLDLETTGGSPTGDRILEIGAVRVDGSRIGETFTTLVNPGVPVPSFISSLTGIRQEMVLDAPRFADVGEQVARFIDDSVIVAHNLPFDLGFLNQELHRGCGFVLANPALCTVRLGRRLLPQLLDRRLETLAEYYGLGFSERHRALGDAEVTARLLVKFIGLLEERGIEDLPGVERFLARTPGFEEEVSDPERLPQQSPPPLSSDES